MAKRAGRLTGLLLVALALGASGSSTAKQTGTRGSATRATTTTPSPTSLSPTEATGASTADTCRPKTHTVGRSTGAPSQLGIGQREHAALSLDAVARKFGDAVAYDYTDRGQYYEVVEHGPDQRELVAAVINEVRSLRLPVEVKVLESCVRFSTLQSIRKEIASQPWASSVGFMTLEIDEVAGKVAVTVSERSRARQLRARYGDAVRVAVAFGGLTG